MNMENIFDFFGYIPDEHFMELSHKQNKRIKTMTRKQKKLVLIAVAILRKILGNNYEVKCRLEDILCSINMEEVFDVDSIDPMTDWKEQVKAQFGDDPVGIADILLIAKNTCVFPENLTAALLEINPGDLRRFHASSFTPPYFLAAFRRNFNINFEVNHD